MPVILEAAYLPVWLEEAPGDPTALLPPPPAGTPRVRPVDRRVNSLKNDGPELLKPLVEG